MLTLERARELITRSSCCDFDEYVSLVSGLLRPMQRMKCPTCRTNDVLVPSGEQRISAEVAAQLLTEWP